MFDTFIDIIEKLVKKHAPIRTVENGGQNSKISKPWLRKLKHLIAQKHF